MDLNQTQPQEAFTPLLAAAERILSSTLGGPVHLDSVERLTKEGRRNLLLRCGSSGPSGNFPASFILKKVEMSGDSSAEANAWDTRRFFSDWAGAQFLSTVRPEAGHSPRFYGGDRELGFFILEDLGPHRSLVEPLLEEDAASATRALLHYAARLGRLHAETIGRAALYDSIFQASGSTAMTFAHDLGGLQEQIKRFQAGLERLGAPSETSLSRDFETISAALTNPGSFLAYIHSDPCPDNVFYNGEQLRLIDFEFGHFGHALIDGVYGRMMFPTCWCANRLPPVLVSQMETTYRAELVKGCPEAQEDRVFETALMIGCGFWLLNSVGWFLDGALEQDREWGIATIRPRLLARLEAFSTTAAEFKQLSGLQGAASRLLDILRRRWPDSQPLPLYPAFRDETLEPGLKIAK
jgi:hypothetical protein